MDLNGMLLKWDLIEPLSELKYFGLEAVSSVSPVSLLLGGNLGALGASQVLMILLGGLYLIGMRRLRWHIPLSFLAGGLCRGSRFQSGGPADLRTAAFPSAYGQHHAGGVLFHLFSEENVTELLER